MVRSERALSAAEVVLLPDSTVALLTLTDVYLPIHSLMLCGSLADNVRRLFPMT